MGGRTPAIVNAIDPLIELYRGMPQEPGISPALERIRDHDWSRLLTNAEAVDLLGTEQAAYARRRITPIIGWWIPTRESVDAIRAFVGDTPIIEHMAGTGYAAHHLLRAGLDVACFGQDGTGPREHRTSVRWAPLQVDDIRTYQHPEGYALMLSWIPYGSDAANQALESAPSGTRLILIGEERGNAAADSTFDILARDYDQIGAIAIPTWATQHDRMTFHVRRGVTPGKQPYQGGEKP